MSVLSIVGLGLMGGSLGLAARKNGIADVIKAYARRSETRELALSMEAVDAVYDQPSECVKDADIVVFCTPVLTIPELALNCTGNISADTAVTDVGSTKTELVDRMQGMFAGFVGSHPMAGSEQAGLEAASADLYDGCVVILTPTDKSQEPAVDRLTTMWEGVGSRVVTATPAEHDATVARTSHLPHLLASLLASHVGQAGDSAAADFCGTGFRDTTRIAEGSPDIWHDILATNSDIICEELTQFGSALDSLKDRIARKDFDGVRAFLEEARESRRKLT